MNSTQPANLITPKTLSSFALRKSKRLWTQLGTAALLASTIGIAWFQYTRSVTQQQVAQIVNAADGPRKVLHENNRLQQRIDELASVDSRQQEMRGIFPPLAVLSLLAEIKQQLDGELTVEQFDYTLDVTGAATKNNGKITLQLVTSDAIHSSAFIEQLTQSGLFRDVQLNTAVVKASPETDDVRFGVACTF